MNNSRKKTKSLLFFLLFILIILVLDLNFNGDKSLLRRINLGASGRVSDFFKQVESIFGKKGKSYTIPNIETRQQIVSEESTVIDAVEKVSPAVVSIVVKTFNFDFFTGPTTSDQGIGTGFIVDPNGLIVTNSHVVDDPSGEYTVVLKDGTTYEVDKIHLDEVSDLAILEVSARNLPTVQFGDSEHIKVGQMAIAIGNALGRFQNTVTVGVVSGVSRELQATSGFGDVKIYENIIQTDAALNPGNSGGPLVNSSGQVIGINVATSVGADNISFAIPVNTLMPILQGFLRDGRIVRPYIGVSYTMITEEIARIRNLPEGAFISLVASNSPADKAGLKRGDIITKIDDSVITTETTLSSIVGKSAVGDTLVLTVDRDGEEKKISIVVGEAPDNSR